MEENKIDSFNAEQNDMSPDQEQDDKELIYNENIGFQNVDRLFEENADQPVFYEIEFKITDKTTKSHKYVKVDLEKISYQKPMIGGFVNKTSGIYYFNSYAQTDQYVNPKVTSCERDAQTYFYKSRSTKANREFGTQMQKIGLYIDIRTDKILEATEYFCANDWEIARDNCVQYLQKCVRGYLSRKLANEYRKEVKIEKQIREEKEEKERKEEEEKNKREIERRTHPKSKQDFYLLRQELDSWVQRETEKIKGSDLSQEDKTLALQELLHKEISLLETIEKLKISAKKENNAEKIQAFLAKMSADKVYKRYDGHPILISTVFTQIAGKLEEQFKNLNSSTSVDIRLKNLLEFKQLMLKHDQENPCSLIKEIIELIEREADMLTRGRPDHSLEGLRQRLNNKYLSFIEIPKFNFEAADYQKLPKDWLADLYKKKK